MVLSLPGARLSCGDVFFFFNVTAPTAISTLSPHDALPIFGRGLGPAPGHHQLDGVVHLPEVVGRHVGRHADGDARRAIDQQAGEQAGEDDGLLGLAVVGGAEVDEIGRASCRERV